MKFFTFKEFRDSETARSHGLENDFPTMLPMSYEVPHNIVELVYNVLDPLREIMGRPVYVTSGYRTKELNKLLKGAKRSQHLYGKAADITCNNYDDNLKMAYCLLKFIPEFDQAILYRRSDNMFNFTWIHVSWNGKGNRNKLLMEREGVYSLYFSPDREEVVARLEEEMKCRKIVFKTEIQ